MKTADFIIVGAGSAGCVMADALSKSGAYSVSLLEGGKSDNYHWIHIPVGYLYCINNPRTDWQYRTEKEAGLNGRSLLYPRGKGLGGSSNINGMIYMRGQAADYDSWAQSAKGWSWAECLPTFKAQEDYHRGASEYHGAGGAWRVEPMRVKWAALETVKQALLDFGVKNTPDFNQGDNEGVGYFEVTQRSGWRLNTTKAFLRPAMQRQNLSVKINAVVDKLVFEGQRCVGVRLADGAVLTANKGVVLCAGAVSSPAILERSGVGNPAVLAPLGVSVHHALPGVGENLQDHLQLRMSYRVSNIQTLNTLANSLWGKFKIAMEYALFRRGPMSMAPSQLGAFLRSSPKLDRANIEYHIQPLSLDAFGSPLHRYDAITTSVCNLRPTSRGSIHIQSTNPNDAPLIKPNYLATAEDEQVALDSVKITREWMQQSALEPYAPQEVKPGACANDTELLAKIRDIGTTIFHPVGTCKMGAASDASAVVNERLAVHGLQGLWIADASIMPTITSGNTNAPTMMIAQRGAEFILKDCNA